MIEFIDVESPIANGDVFFYSVGVVGEMSSGKSTFVNGLFGDVLSEVSLDRTTMIPHRFYESPDVKENKDIWWTNRDANVLAKTNWQKQQKDMHSNWIKSHWNNYNNNRPKFGDFPCYKIKPSDVVPRKGTVYSM